MKKISINKIIIILIVFTIIILCGDLKNNDEDNKSGLDFLPNNEEYVLALEDIHATIEVLDDGYDIFTCNGYGYRYGPSIIYNEDGSLDLWISSPGNNTTEWDYIRYMHSDDGVEWSDEKIVLKPTRNSLDHYSTCDPGVIYFNGYYYLGYTSTTNSKGYDNDIFVARSENPDGPFEKWNGESWGGEPKPIIDFTGSEEYWGAGEISFCIKDDTLYCYYSWYGEDGDYCKVATADLSENWPSSLVEQGMAFKKGSGEDSCDVIYVEEYERFLSVSIGYRLSDMSSIVIHESSDGLTFNKVDDVDENINNYCHSIGISKKADGSIDLDDNLYIGYAYGNMGWGKWSACIQPIKIKTIINKEK